MHLKFRKKFFIYILLFNFIVFFFVSLLKDEKKIFLKYLLFSRITNEKKFQDQKSIDELINKKFKLNNRSPEKYFEVSVIRKLKDLKNNFDPKSCKKKFIENPPNVNSTDCLALEISLESAPKEYLDACLASNIINIEERVKKIKNGDGCCSDTTESYIIHSQLIDFPVRELHAGNNHTFIEYYDEKLDKWKIIDTYKKQFITDDKGNFLKAFKKGI